MGRAQDQAWRGEPGSDAALAWPEGAVGTGWGSWARDGGGGSPRWGWPGTARAVSAPSALTQGALCSTGVRLCSSRLSCCS